MNQISCGRRGGNCQCASVEECILDRDAMIPEGDSKTARWIREHKDYPHDWCLIWPFARTQHGYAIFGEGNRRVHRVMCEYRHGPAPTPEHHAAHSCDRGHDACVNPRHVDWKTPSENQFDRHKDGKPKPRIKLTPEQAKQIRDLKGLERTQDTAARFGIRESNVRLIQSGQTWRADKPGIRTFTRDEVLAIRADKRFCKDIAAQFGVSSSIIQNIKTRKTYRYFEDAAP